MSLKEFALALLTCLGNASYLLFFFYSHTSYFSISHQPSAESNYNYSVLFLLRKVTGKQVLQIDCTNRAIFLNADI
jgi:hypothetical protein